MRVGIVCAAALALGLTLFAPRQSKGSEDVWTDRGVPPEIIRRVAPIYPDSARAHGIEGVVVVQALIDREGHVAGTRIVKSIAELDSAAVSTVRQWTFQPARVDSEAVPVWVAIPIKVQLARPETDGESAVTAPICQDGIQRSRERGRPVPELCAARRGDEAVFVLGPPADGALEPAAFDRAAYTDSCDVELSLWPSGFARGGWPCDRQTNRVLIPVGLSTRSWLLGDHPIVVESVKGLDLLSGVEFKPIDLWWRLFGSLADQRSSPRSDPQPDNGVFDDETLPVAILKVQPEYPKEARNLKISGTVIVRALVDTHGRVAVAQIMQSIPELDQAALAAIREWAFTPARDGNKPVAVWVAVPIKFTLK